MYSRGSLSMSSLGLFGGVLGILMGLFALIAGGIGALLHIAGAYGYFLGSWIAIFLSAVGIIGAFAARIEQLAGGVTMLVAGAVGIYLVGGFFIIPSVILLLAGSISSLDSFRPWTARTIR